jgi:hypothetical protein
MRCWSLFLLIVAFFCIGAVVRAQITPGDVTNQLTWDEWTDALLYEERTTDDVSGEIIHLDRALSKFENGWVASHPDYYFEITGIVAFDENDQADTQFGYFHDVDTNGQPLSGAITAPPDHRVSNAQGLIQWSPVAVDHDQTIRVFFRLTSATATKQCTLLIERYQSCLAIPALKDSKGNTVHSPPVPQCRIHFESSLQRFTLKVNATYLRDDATYLVDFDDFDPKLDNLRYMYGNCANRDSLPPPAQLPFREMWYSAPTSTYPHSIDGSYPAYKTRSSWMMDNEDHCDRIVYNTSYSFNDLTHCQNRGIGSGYAVALTTENSMLMYRGNVYVNVLVPIDLNQEQWGYTKFRHVYPFEFGFKQRVSALVGTPTEQDLRVFIRSAQLLPNGQLQLVVETQYARLEGLKAPSVNPNRLLITQGSDPCSGSGSSQLCIQEWHYATDVNSPWSVADNHAYSFGWQAVYDSHPMTVTITIQQQLQEVQSETGLDIGSLQLRVFYTQSDLVLGQNPVNNDHTFDPRDTVYVRADLVVPTDDQQNFGLRVVNAYLCYSAIEGYQIEYAENGKQGCLDPFILDTERFHLIDESQVGGDANVVDFSTNLLDSVQQYLNPAGPTDSFSFLANPQQQVDRIYTIHVECEITQRAPSAKRAIDGSVEQAAPGTRIHFVSTVPTEQYARTIEFAPQTHSLRAESGDQAASVATISVVRQSPPEEASPSHSMWTIVLGGGICFAVVGVAASAFLVYRRKQTAQYALVSEVDFEQQ